jgi:type VI protein secretion system component Hcp
VSAQSIYLDIPTIAGEGATPGYPNDFHALSLSFAPPSLSIVNYVDTSTPSLQLAVADATNLGTVNALLYNSSTPTGPPDAIVPFGNCIATSLVIGAGGPPVPETLTINAIDPQVVYLELPGITGPANTPGNPGVIPIDSFSISGDTLTIDKLVDSSSAAIGLAVASGTQFDASLLFYDSLSPSGPPDTMVTFDHSLASSHTVMSGGDEPTEQDTFNFVSVSQPVPEPAGWMVLLGAVSAVMWNRRRAVNRRFHWEA